MLMLKAVLREDVEVEADPLNVLDYLRKSTIAKMPGLARHTEYAIYINQDREWEANDEETGRHVVRKATDDEVKLMDAIEALYRFHE